MNNIFGNSFFPSKEDLNPSLEAVADKIAIRDENVECEKCGGETDSRLIGDEWVEYCGECDWTTIN